MMGMVVGGGGVELCSLYMFFSSFSDYFAHNMCFNITVGPNNITLGCCNNGTRYVSRNWNHWSRLVHPECNIHNNTIIVDSIEDGDGWDGESILLLVFILLFVLFGIIGMWRRRWRGRCAGRRREREESEDQEDEGGVEMGETTV